MRSISGQYRGSKSKAMLHYQVHMHVKGVLSVVRQHVAEIQSAPSEIDCALMLVLDRCNITIFTCNAVPLSTRFGWINSLQWAEGRGSPKEGTVTVTSCLRLSACCFPRCPFSRSTPTTCGLGCH